MSSLQDIRFKLQKRIKRLQTIEPIDFGAELIRFWGFFDSNDLLLMTAAELQAAYPNVRAEWDALPRGQLLCGTTEAESAAIGYEILRRVAGSDDKGYAFMNYVEPVGDLSKMMERFCETYLEPLYEYLDEHLEDRNIVLAELVRFKHLAEWFRRQQLWAKFTEESRLGERNLAFAVYEFLYEQGIDFHIEPTSASGEADMVSAQQSRNPLVADVKVYDPGSSRGHSYIRKGFHQVYRYLQDFNQPVGYLVVFAASDKQLQVTTSETQPTKVPSLTINQKTIFLIQIDIFPHSDPASRRPIPEQESISEAELKAELERAS
jgi:hypothetical protein